MRRSFLVAAVAASLAAATGTGTASVGQLSSASSGCPASAPAPAPGRASRGVLVPPGATALLLCRYHGLNPPATAHRLERERLLTAVTEPARIAAELNALPKPPPAIACPMDDGSEITVTFRYPSPPAVVVEIGLTGCRTVSNGRLTRTASTPAGSRLIDELIALVP